MGEKTGGWKEKEENINLPSRPEISWIYIYEIPMCYQKHTNLPVSYITQCDPNLH